MERRITVQIALEVDYGVVPDHTFVRILPTDDEILVAMRKFNRAGQVAYLMILEERRRIAGDR